MQACLVAGCHYMDLGGLYHVTAEQLKLSKDFAERGLLALLGIGSAPGKTNLLAARARPPRLTGEPAVDLGRSPPAATSIPPDGLSFPYAVRTLLDEITMAPMALINGRPQEMLADAAGPAHRLRGSDRSGGERSSRLHSEVLTFGEPASELRNVTFALSLSPCGAGEACRSWWGLARSG